MEENTTKFCKTCNQHKVLTTDNFRRKKYKTKTGMGEYWTLPCRICEREYNLRTNKERYIRTWTQRKIKRDTRKAAITEYNKKYEADNKEKRKIYRAGRIDKERENQRLWFKKQRNSDPSFKLRQYISGQIAYGLRKANSSKNGKSCINYLSYTLEELKQHLESKFEPWMTWQNHGRYDSKAWDDNDSSTWMWQLDHIIPHSLFNYTSMEDEEFKKAGH